MSRPMMAAAFLLSVCFVFYASPAFCWQTNIDGGTDNRNDTAWGVAVDTAGDVAAAGILPGVRQNGNSCTWFSVAKFSGLTGTEKWRHQIENPACSSDHANAVAIDGNGDVVAAGFVYTDTFRGEFVVIKLDGDDGGKLWGTGIRCNPDHLARDGATAVAVDSAGDVFAAGVIRFVGKKFAVVKLDGNDGSELWRVTFQGERRTGAYSLIVDPNGAVIAAGALEPISSLGFGEGPHWFVVKLSGDGQVLWTRLIPDVQGSAVSVALDGTGNVFAAGGLNFIVGQKLEGRYTIMKLSAADGSVVWTSGIDFGYAFSVATDSNGDLITGGQLMQQAEGQLPDEVGNRMTFPSDFIVAKISGQDGGEIWRHVIPGTGYEPHNQPTRASSVVVDDDDNVLAAGKVLLHTATGYAFTVLKLAGLDGTPLWVQSMDGNRRDLPLFGREDAAHALTLDSGGNVIAVGSVVGAATKGNDFAVTMLNNVNGGTSRLISGKNLRVVSRADTTRNSIAALFKDKINLIIPGRGTSSDPTVGGALLELLNPDTGEITGIDLPAPLWRGLGNPSGSKGYLFKSDVCRRVSLRPRRLSVSCRGVDVDFTLDEESQGRLAVRLTTGSPGVNRYCMLFEGTTVLKDEPGLFRARNAPLSDTCPVSFP